MKWTLLLIFCGMPPVFAHEGEDLSLGCWYGTTKPQTLKKKFPGGFQLHIKANPNLMDDPEHACTGTLTDKAGKVVFTATGYRVYYDQVNSKTDFDHDKKAELVLRTDSYGGQRSCCKYHFISLTSKPAVYEFEDGGQMDVKKDKSGKAILLRFEGGPIEFTSMARRPYATRVFQIRNGQLADITREHCDKLTAASFFQEQEEQLKPEVVAKFRSGEKLAHDSESVTSAALSNALQMLYCRKKDEAKKYIGYFPESEQPKVRTAFAEHLKDIPEAAALTQ